MTNRERCECHDCTQARAAERFQQQLQIAPAASAPRITDRDCLACGAPLIDENDGRRKSTRRRTCSNACRQRLSRDLRKQHTPDADSRPASPVVSHAHRE